MAVVVGGGGFLFLYLTCSLVIAGSTSNQILVEAGFFATNRTLLCRATPHAHRRLRFIFQTFSKGQSYWVWGKNERCM